MHVLNGKQTLARHKLKSEEKERIQSETAGTSLYFQISVNVSTEML